MKYNILLNGRAIQIITVNFFIVLAEEGLAYQALIEEADEEFVEKHYTDIDLESLRNVLQTMKKVNASI
ncbi:hypothetical protein P4646_18465 [Peribacillus simplex]|nr:hypothetical protein [Peribacillus simplex]MED3986024.1 hypothetical protein [Peribacillus simplex]MED4096972.1 hypothetical protein [Peribacillus simplex]